MEAWPEGGDFLDRHAAAILRHCFGRLPGHPLPLVISVSNPVNSTDKVFLRHFSMVIGFLILVMFFLIGLSTYLYSKHPAPSAPGVDQRTDQRIVPVGATYAGDTGRAALLAAQEAAKKAAEGEVAYGGTLDGKTIFDQLCTTCHTNPATGAPDIHDKASWAPRVAQGLEILIKHAIDGYSGKDGKGALMPPKGGNPALTDAQVKATVEWMLAQVK